MFSVREIIWKWFFLNNDITYIPAYLITKEIIASIIVAVLCFLFCWYVIRKLFFYISESARSSRAAAINFGLGIGLAWNLGVLELLGFASTKWMIVIMFSIILFNLVYLLIARSR